MKKQIPSFACPKEGKKHWAVLRNLTDLIVKKHNARKTHQFFINLQRSNWLKHLLAINCTFDIRQSGRSAMPKPSQAESKKLVFR